MLLNRAKAFTLSGSSWLLLTVMVFEVPLKALSDEHDVAGVLDILINSLNRDGKAFLF